MQVKQIKENNWNISSFFLLCKVVNAQSENKKEKRLFLDKVRQ